MKKLFMIAMLLAPVAVAAPAFADEPQVRTYTFGAGGPRLGVQVTELSDELRTFFGAPNDAGLLIGKVQPGTAAAAAGIRVGDVLTNIGGTKITSARDVRRALGDRKEGETVPATVVREKKPITLAVKVPKAEPPGPEAFGPPDGQPDFDMPRGMRMFNLDKIGDIEKRLDDIERRLQRLEPH